MLIDSFFSSFKRWNCLKIAFVPSSTVICDDDSIDVKNVLNILAISSGLVAVSEPFLTRLGQIEIGISDFILIEAF